MTLSSLLSLLVLAPFALAQLPALSSTAAASSAASSGSAAASDTKGLPAISSSFSYPAPAVPPTANAPFMQKSTLPQGTVFICAGGAIAVFFAVVIAWRGFAAWSLHRRMNAANTPYTGLSQGKGHGHGGSPRDRKRVRRSAALAPATYSQGAGGSMGLEPLGDGGKKTAAAGQQQGNRNSLFFSPTAGAGAHDRAQNRASAYLPAGYYAAGSTNASNTSGASDRPISMSDFARPQRGQGTAYKDSPSLGPSPGPAGLEPPALHHGGGRSVGSRNSASSLGDASGRAPSAYLEDLFDSPAVDERPSSDRRF